MAVQLLLLLARQDWLDAFLVVGVMTVTAAPALFRTPVDIPSEIQIVAVLFIFCTLFLGEVHGYYARYPWWDASLHTGSGLLLGMLGFMIVYILNEDRQVDLHMRHRSSHCSPFSSQLGSAEYGKSSNLRSTGCSVRTCSRRPTATRPGLPTPCTT